MMFSIPLAYAQTDIVPPKIDVSTGDTKKHVVWLTVDQSNISDFFFINDYDQEGFCIDLFFTGTFDVDDGPEELEVKTRVVFDGEIFQNWIYVITDTDFEIPSGPTDDKSLCESFTWPDELYSDLPDYSLVESTAGTDGSLYFEIFNPEKDTTLAGSVTKSIKITLVGDSYTKWQDFVVDNAVNTKNLNIEKTKIIHNEGSWRSICNGLVLYEKNNPGGTSEIKIDRKFFDTKGDFWVFVFPTGESFNCNDIFLNLQNDPKYVKHQL